MGPQGGAIPATRNQPIAPYPVLRQLLRAKMQCDICLPIRRRKLAQNVATINNMRPRALFCFVLTPGVLQCRQKVLEAAAAVVHDLYVMPVKIDEEFKYPDEEFYNKLRAGEVLPEAAEMLTTIESLIRGCFEEIALYFDANASAAQIDLTSGSVALRYRKNMRSSAGKILTRMSSASKRRLRAGVEIAQQGSVGASDRAGAEVAQHSSVGASDQHGVGQVEGTGSLSSGTSLGSGANPPESSASGSSTPSSASGSSGVAGSPPTGNLQLHQLRSLLDSVLDDPNEAGATEESASSASSPLAWTLDVESDAELQSLDPRADDLEERATLRAMTADTERTDSHPMPSLPPSSSTPQPTVLGRAASHHVAV